MPYAICVLGPSGEATFAFMEKLAGALTQRGLKVGLISPASAPPPALAHLEVGPGSLNLRRPQQSELGLEELLGSYLHELDLVLTSAHPGERRAKIEFCPEGPPRALDDPGLKVLVSPQAQGGALPCFAPDDLAGLAELVATKLLPSGEPVHTRVVLGGRRLPIKGFVQDIVGSTIRAMIASLKGGDRPGRLSVYID